MLPDIYGEFFSEVIRGLDRAARRHGYHILVSGSHSDRAEIAALLRALHGRVDGLIIMSPDVDAETLEERLPATLPTVLLNCRPLDCPFDSLSIDNHGGALAMTRHFLALGHRRIALIEGPRDNYDAQERLRGYRDGLAQAGLEPSPELAFPGDFGEEAGYHAGRAILALAAPPTAIFAINDAMAIGCLFALTERDLVIPIDIAIAGFDDIPIARYVTPPLTTVRVRIADLGRSALIRLVAEMEAAGSSAAAPQILPCEIVVRTSCGQSFGPSHHSETTNRSPIAEPIDMPGRET